MKTHHIPASEFKAKCLRLLDDVAVTGQPLIITKRGRPVAQLMPMPVQRKLFGAMKGSVLSQHDITSPVDAAWEAEA